MNTQERVLYRRLTDFRLDDPASEFCFSDKLAKENCWTAEFARRTVVEYKRFLFLAVTAGHVVTPSDQVDQAWHQHLTYTNSYWNGLCREVLGKEIHHGPTKGGQAETTKYRELYAKTLASYRTTFGSDPPPDIWPDTETRFGTDLECRRVNAHENWVVPKPTRFVKGFIRSRRGETIALGVIPSIFAAWNPFDLAGPQFLVLFGASYLVSITVAIGLRNTMRREDGEANEAVDAALSDPYEAAYLAGGRERVAQAATGTLVRSGVFEIEGSSKRLVAKLPLPQDAHEVESAVYSAAVSTNGKAEGHRFNAYASSALATIRRNLATKGLIETASSFAAARFWSLVAMCPVLILGGIKLSVGISRQKPVGFLIAGLVLTVGTMLWLAFKRPRCTAAGNRVLKTLTNSYRNKERVKDAAQEGNLNTDIAFSIGLLGLSTALPAGDPVVKLFNPTTVTTVGGCGAGSDGGGGGGGCGGCGG